jgi:ATP-dependent Lhr-like helicase
MLPEVIRAIERARSTLVFTNVRSATEMWYQALLAARPDWAGTIALHHGSLERDVRDWVEAGLRDGRLRAVCARRASTSAWISRRSTRCCRSEARRASAVFFSAQDAAAIAPANFAHHRGADAGARARRGRGGAERGARARIEPRHPVVDPPDVLVQHLVTCALGGGFRPDELRDEVRGTHAFAGMSEIEWQWALDFVVHGGASLNAYPEYRRVVIGDDGVAHVPDRGIARRHRMSIGTIVSDASITVQFRNGARLGQVEESFVASLTPGDCFAFAGASWNSSACASSPRG